MSRRIHDILEGKGHEVVTIAPDATLHDVLAVLAEHNIGALVVSRDGNAIDGVISERDVVRVLARTGSVALDQNVNSIMTTTVKTCTTGSGTDDAMSLMTDSRIRHLPVVDDGKLVGMISIGDVVKSRIGELETQTEQLENYVTGSAY